MLPFSEQVISTYYSKILSLYDSLPVLVQKTIRETFIKKHVRKDLCLSEWVLKLRVVCDQKSNIKEEINTSYNNKLFTIFEKYHLIIYMDITTSKSPKDDKKFVASLKQIKYEALKQMQDIFSARNQE